jgi:hypothetical protein
VNQRVYPDTYGIDTWNMDNAGSVFIHIVNSRQYRAVTGRYPPPTPLDAKTYIEHGFPWFELYDEPGGRCAGFGKLVAHQERARARGRERAAGRREGIRRAHRPDY